jgi:succinyl-CoA synthetase beta subunit
MAAKGVNVPIGYPARTVEEAVAAAAKIGDDEVVIKSQVRARRRTAEPRAAAL